jgi:IclR family transcriptional regulator, mhp operon transcriptional activator
MRPAPIGLKFPLVTSIGGRVYLAYCSADQRAILIQAVLGDNPAALNDIDLSPELLDRQLDSIKERGFYCDQMPHKGHSSLAAPVMDANGIRAVLDIRFPIRSLSVKEASARFADAVMDGAEKIGSKIKSNKNILLGMVT